MRARVELPTGDFTVKHLPNGDFEVETHYKTYMVEQPEAPAPKAAKESAPCR